MTIEAIPLHLDRMHFLVIHHCAAPPLSPTSAQERLFAALVRFAVAEDAHG